METEVDYITPLVVAVVGGIVAIASAYIGTRVMTIYADRRLKKLNEK